MNSIFPANVPARVRLAKIGEFGPVFEGSLAMQLFGWDAKTAAQYLWLWNKGGLVKPLGGKSDLFFNLAAHPDAENHREAAIRRAMPWVVLGFRSVLHDAGITTQRTGLLSLAMRKGARTFKIEGVEFATRPASFWKAVEAFGGVKPGSSESLPRLTQGAAVAESAIAEDGFDPDDIDFGALTVREERLARSILLRMGCIRRGDERPLEVVYTGLRGGQS